MESTTASDHGTSAACPACGTINRPAIGPGNGPHAFRARCAHCGQFIQWLSKFPLADRQARRVQARQAAMATKPPTAHQLDYLQALGDSGPPPASMREASERIDALKRGEVVR